MVGDSFLERVMHFDVESFRGLEGSRRNAGGVDLAFLVTAASYRSRRFSGRVGVSPAGFCVSRKHCGEGGRSLRRPMQDRAGRMPAPAGETPTLPETSATVAQSNKVHDTL